MRIIRDVRQFRERLPHVVLTIGSFDGVHVGHQRIIERVREAASAHDGTAALMTLRPHPRQFFSPDSAPNLLTTDSLQEELLAEAGIGVLFILPFNADVANLTPEAFVRDIIVGRCGAAEVIVGHDFAFGKQAAGNFEFLESMAAAQGFTVRQERPLVIQGERVSSTLLRERVLQGELEGIERILGRRYILRGCVRTGRGMGRRLGFPTANVLPGRSVIPAHGVYIAETRIDGECHASAVNIGVAPTIRQETIVVESHILDYEGDLAGKEIDIIFHKRLRPEKKYPSVTDLIAAIDADVAEVRSYFSH